MTRLSILITEDARRSFCDSDFFVDREYDGSLNHTITLAECEKLASTGVQIEIERR